MDLMDEIFRDAQRKGEFSNLPGEGKPLRLDEDGHTPAHLRSAYKLLKDNDMAPDWIEQGHSLDQRREKLIDALKRAAHTYRGALNDAARSPEPEQYRQRAERVWLAAQNALREQAGQYNREVLSYNLKVPRGIIHKTTLNLDLELSRLSVR
jgi:hypothetical protein